MTDEPRAPELRLVQSATDEHDPSPDGGSGADEEPLAAMVRRIEDLPLRERPAAFERVNATLVAELNALEEV